MISTAAAQMCMEVSTARAPLFREDSFHAIPFIVLIDRAWKGIIVVNGNVVKDTCFPSSARD